MNRICAAYLRVSTHEQEEYSPDSQLRLIREYAEKNGMELPEEYVFRDDGISGRSAEKRPGFQRMIAKARQKPRAFDCILVWKFSRFARNQEESVVYKSLLKKEAGVEVVSISEPLLEGPFGELIERIIEWFDAFYSANLSVEVRRGMDERRSRGLAVSGAPLGYAYQNGELAAVPEEAETVRLIYREFLRGTPVGTLARRLNTLGCRTKRGGLWESRTVRYVLENPLYAGLLRQGVPGKESADSLREGRHPALVPLEDFQAARRLLSDHAGKSLPAPRPGGSIPLLRGLAKCGACGASLSRSGKGMNCSRYVHGKCGESHYIGEKKLESLVLAAVSAQLGELEYVLPAKAAEAAGEEARTLRRLCAREREALRRCREAYAAGVDGLEEYRQNKAAITARLEELDRRLSELEQRSAGLPGKIPPPVRNAVGELTGSTLSPEEKNALLSRLAVRVVFHRQSKTLELFYAASQKEKPGQQPGIITSCKEADLMES